MLLSADTLALAVVAQACGDELKWHFAGMWHEGDAQVVIILRFVLLLEKHLRGGVFPLLWHLSCVSRGGDDTMKSPGLHRRIG